MSEPSCRPASIGGQAVIEGVMMRGPSSFAVAVRTSDGRIAVRDRPWRSVAARRRWLRRPFFRGIVVLIESLANGMSALTWSAEIAGREEKKGEVGQSPAAAPEAARPASDANVWWVLVPTLLFALLVFKGVPHLVALAVDALVGGHGVRDVLFHVVDGVAKLGLFVGYLLLISRMEEIRRVFAYHGAEHKAIAAFEASQPLTLAGARDNSRRHPRCGTAFLLFVILVGVLLYMATLPFLPPLASPAWLNQIVLVLLKMVMLLPIAGIAYEVIRLSGRYAGNPVVRAFAAPGLWMQGLVTREPTDDQIEIALVSIETVLAREAEQAAAGAAPSLVDPGRDETVFPDFEAFRAALAARGR